MVDTQAVDLAGLHQLEDKLMRFFEDGRILHPDGAQGIDIEESAIVDFLGGNAPMGNAIDLLPQKCIQQIEAARVALYPVEDGHIAVTELPDGAAVLIKVPQAPLDDLLFPVALRDPLGILRCGGRKMPECRYDAVKLLKLRRIHGKLLLQAFDSVGQDVAVGLRYDR